MPAFKTSSLEDSCALWLKRHPSFSSPSTSQSKTKRLSTSTARGARSTKTPSKKSDEPSKLTKASRTPRQSRKGSQEVALNPKQTISWTSLAMQRPPLCLRSTMKALTQWSKHSWTQELSMSAWTEASLVVIEAMLSLSSNPAKPRCSSDRLKQRVLAWNSLALAARLRLIFPGDLTSTTKPSPGHADAARNLAVLTRILSLTDFKKAWWLQ